MNFLRGPDTIYALRFLRLLTMPWTKMKAYRAGVIDEYGNRIADPETSYQKGSYTIFHRLVFNVRRLLQRVPGGGSTIGRYAAALALIKEHTDITDDTIIEALENLVDFTLSEDAELNLVGCKVTMQNPAIGLATGDEIGDVGDVVEITDLHSHVTGVAVYEGVHQVTGQRVLVSNQDVS
jgi:hypothetical protein